MAFSLIKPMMEQETDVALIALVTIRVDDVPKFWLANFYQDVEHQRQTYQAMPIESIVLPASKDGELPVIQFIVTDVEQTFAAELRRTAGRRTKIEVDLKLVMSGDVEQVFDSWSGFRVLGGIDYDEFLVSVQVSPVNLKNQSIIKRRQTPHDFPGLY